MVQQAYVEGVSTRRVDDLVRSLGCEGHLEEPGLEDLRRARHRRHERTRAAARRRSVPLPLARRAHPAGARGGPHRPGQRRGRHRRRADGKREVLDALTSARARTGPSGSHFSAWLVARGLSGVELADLRRPSRPQGGDRDRLRRRAPAPPGSAAGRTSRNLLTRVPKSAEALVQRRRCAPSSSSAASAATGGARPARSRGGATGRALPRGRGALDEAAAEVLAFTACPVAHWKQVWSNNPQAAPRARDPPAHRRGRHLPRNRAAVVRQRGAVLAVQHDEWAVASAT